MATTTTLPPVRTPNYLPQALTPSVSEETISLWLKLGAMEKLEQAVLDGHGDLLCGRTSRLPQVNKFLRQVPLFQNKIQEIHQAVAEGKIREVQHLIDRKKLAFCRDQAGASPLHKAVIFGHKDIIQYLLERYSAVLHIRDHQGRTPLHYAAFLADGGEIYQMLIEAGADTKATDVFGKQPDYYMKLQDETALQELRDGYINNDIRKIKQRKQQQNAPIKLHKGYSRQALGRVQIKELISKGDLEALEEIVLHGYGGLLLGETSANTTIQDFLNKVPFYLKRIHDIHRAAIRGRLQEIIRLLDHKSFAIAMDQLGATALHKAVWYGNYDVAEHIANSFPVTVNVADLDGRTPLHYAAVLRDDKEIYNMLVNTGANRSVQDNKGKTPEYYAQHMELLKLEDVIRRNQRINATNMANIINHTRSKLPLRGTPPSVGKDGISSSSTSDISGQDMDDEILDFRSSDDKYEDYMHYSYNNMDAKNDSLIKSLPPLPPVKSQCPEISSATVRKWMQEEDMDKLKQAVVEGYGDMMMKEGSESEKMQDYLSNSVPMMLEKIHSIHGAVSHDDLLELQTRLDSEEFVGAKDSLGRTPLHKAVILSHTKIVKFLCYNFPEIIDITDKEGRTALHYAAAGTRKENLNIYKVLLQTGADPKIRDKHGKTADYYRTHRMPTSYKLPSKPKMTPGLLNQQPESGSYISKQGVLEKITTALQKCDIEALKAIVLEGNGKYLIGKTSWNDEVRQYLKTIPYYLSTIRSLHEAVAAGDIITTEKRLSEDENLLRSRDDTGATPIHIAVSHKQPEIVKFLATKYPAALNYKDNASRTPLILAAQDGDIELYRMMVEAGADTMILDQKGRSAEYYLSELEKDKKSPHQLLSSVDDKTCDDDKSQQPKTEDADDITISEEKPTEEAVLKNNTENPASEQNKDDQREERANEVDLNIIPISEQDNDNNATETEPALDSIEKSVTEPNKELAEDASCKDQPEDFKENVETLSKDKINLNDETIEASKEDNSQREDEDAVSDTIKENVLIEIPVIDAKEAPPVTEQTDDKAGNTEITRSEENAESNEIVALDDDKQPESLNDNATEDTLTTVTEENVSQKTKNEEEKSVKSERMEQEDNIENANNESSLTEHTDEASEQEKGVDETTEKEGNTEQSASNQKENSIISIDVPKQETNEKQVDSVENSEEIPANMTTKVSEEQQDKQLKENEDLLLTNEVSSIKGDQTMDVGQDKESVKDTDYSPEDESIEEPTTDKETKPDVNQDDIENNEYTKENVSIKTPDENGNAPDQSTSNEMEIKNEINTDVADDNVKPEASSEIKTDDLLTANEGTSIKESNETIQNGENEENSELNKDTENQDSNQNQDSKNDATESEEKSDEVIPNNEDENKQGQMNGNDSSTADNDGKTEQLSDTPKEVAEDNENARSNSTDTNNHNTYNKKSSGRNRKPGSRTSHTKDYLDELIEQWIKDGDLLRLEHVVLAGQGDRLTEKTSEDKQVQDFLDLVPIYTAKIRAIHEAIIRGNLQEVRAVLTRKRFALSRDHVGASPLHLAVLHGHYDVIQYIITHFPETMNGPDNEGRTPLHYAAVIPDEGYLYTMLKHAGADENIKDKMGYTPRQYFEHEGELTVRDLWDAYRTGEDP